MQRLYDHLYIFLTIFFGVYSQLVIRWQVDMAGDLPISLMGKAGFIFRLLLKPWVISAMAATFLSGISWMLAMSKFELSYAFPFVSLNYVMVLLAGYYIFHDSFSLQKLIGTALVVCGLIVISQA